MAHMAPRTFAINPGTLAIPVLPSKILPLRVFHRGKTRRGFSLFAVRPRRGCHLGQQPDAVLSCSYLLLSFFHQGRVTLQRVLVLRIDGAEAHASSFSCSHDHDHAGEWRRFTGLPIHLIFQTSGQKPDFRTVQDMVLEPAGVSACGNQ